MISSSKPPSRLRKALALPVLLAAMALACSKEQGAPAAATKQLPKDIVVQLKARRDSVVRIRPVGTLTPFINDQVIHAPMDPEHQKTQLDLISVEGSGKGPLAN